MASRAPLVNSIRKPQDDGQPELKRARVEAEKKRAVVSEAYGAGRMAASAKTRATPQGRAQKKGVDAATRHRRRACSVGSFAFTAAKVDTATGVVTCGPAPNGTVAWPVWPAAPAATAVPAAPAAMAVPGAPPAPAPRIADFVAALVQSLAGAGSHGSVSGKPQLTVTLQFA